jgi:tetratricopeptide (TPR) repeat protein
MRSLTCLIVLLFAARSLLANSFGPETFYNSYVGAKSDSERIYHLGNLAGYYYAIREDATADSIVEKQIMLAEETRNRNWILAAHFNNPRYILLGTVTRNSQNIVTKEASATTLSYIERALSYARAIRDDEHIAQGYTLLSLFYLREGEFEQAMKYANHSYSTAIITNNDSLKATSALWLGCVYKNQKNMLMAYKHYSHAFDIANDTRHPVLLPLVYHYFADLYAKMGKKEEAIDYLYKSIELNKINHNSQGLVNDYLAMGIFNDYTIAMEYLDKAETLANSTGDLFGVIEARKFRFSYKLFQGNVNEPLQYIDNNPVLKHVWEKTGPNYFDWIMAEVYYYGGKPELAHPFFKAALPSLDRHYNIHIKQRFFGELATYYRDIDSIPQAISMFEKTMAMCYTTSSTNHLMNTMNDLSKLYYLKNDYKTAYDYKAKYMNFRDSVNAIAKEEDLAALEIDNLNKKRQKDVELQALEETRRHNIQYMVITLCIAAIFTALIFLGFFPVSRIMIRILGFFAFILFFEFIILIADHKIHHMMHGEPLKIWLVKIVLLSMLLPLHHVLEEKMVHFLNSKKLVSWRQRFSAKKLMLAAVSHLRRHEENRAVAEPHSPESNSK